jgi:hypothetical protein
MSPSTSFHPPLGRWTFSLSLFSRRKAGERKELKGRVPRISLAEPQPREGEKEGKVGSEKGKHGRRVWARPSSYSMVSENAAADHREEKRLGVWLIERLSKKEAGLGCAQLSKQASRKPCVLKEALSLLPRHR